MSRRTASLVVAGLLLVALSMVAGLRPVPYVKMRPGPVKNTLGEHNGTPIVRVSGHRTYPTTGALDLTTVSVTAPTAALNLGQALMAWFDPEEALVPRDLYYPPQVSVQQTEHESAVEMASSQDSAAVAALTELGYKVPIAVKVQSVVKGAPAQGHLQVGDAITAVGGTPVEEATDVSRLLQRVQPGQTADLTVRRDGRVVQVQSPTEADPADPSRAVVGVTIAGEPTLPFDVSIELSERIGGPSAGLMFSLAIIDKLTPGALTGGERIAGTGTITPDGRVGPIGGIQQKIPGAADSGAAVFLVPSANCGEALRAQGDDIRLVRVRTLASALDSVQKLARDPQATVPTCAP